VYGVDGTAKVRVLHRTGNDLGIGDAALRSLLANAIKPLSPFCSWFARNTVAPRHRDLLCPQNRHCS
jgi:hypothetical protein